MTCQHSKLLGALLPPGTALKPDPGTTLAKILDGMGVEFDRFVLDCENLIKEANPLTMNTMLPVRYLEAGLPRPCRGNFTVDFDKKQEVVAVWADRGGASPEYLTWIAGLYGYEVRIFEYDAFHVEQSMCETIGVDDEYTHSFQVNFVYNPTTSFHPFLVELTPVETIGVDDGDYPIDDHYDPVYVRPLFLVEQSPVETPLYYDYFEDEKDYKSILYAGPEAMNEQFPTYDIACVFEGLKPAHTTAVYLEWPIGTNLADLKHYW